MSENKGRPASSPGPGSVQEDSQLPRQISKSAKTLSLQGTAKTSNSKDKFKDKTMAGNFI